MKQTQGLNKIPLTEEVTLLQAPKSINAELMTDEEIIIKLQKGYEDIKQGKTQDARIAFERLRDKY